MNRALLLVAALVSIPLAARADAPAGVAPVEGEPAAGVRHALVIVGHPGDAAHVTSYAETVETLRTALVEQYEFAPERITLLFGAGPDEDEEIPRDARPATREEIERTVTELRGRWGAGDAVWVIVIGHSHFDGRAAHFNVPGPDLAAAEFARLFAGLEAREQVFWITTSVSGYFIKPLSAKRRVVITATEADYEVNETLFPHALAAVLSDPPADAELDADQDGRLTLFDLYLAVVRYTMQQYADATSVATEHPQLDDNGDGRGTELQLDYLSEELGGRAVAGVIPKIPKGADGELAAQIDLRLHRTFNPDDPEPVAAPIPPEQGE